MFGFSSYHPVLFYEEEAAALPHDLLPNGDNPSFQLPLSYLHRSSSGQSHPLHCHGSEPTHPPYSSSSSSSSSCDYVDFKAGPVRRVLSAGNLQGMNCPNASHRVGRYSAEERKERVQRYRNKRNQRNFHKKITYTCRKTLADSRPRVRGRFMRNEGLEIETETEAAVAETPNIVKLYSHDNREEKERTRNNVDVDVDADWRSHLQAELATEDEANSFFDEDLIASFADALSINLYS
ncbi:two-component response regulator-like APRR1 [Zingiber officinale]|uniref:CCT domain-containing protein n=1 Tax=Zingiber officinale TaxID=94328 RepID=A0A8J5C462_ZINOF|nr:two-component response regulator-like APRR1 [Zingiber officinale]KAG6472005.1 hypothetical protein ZIOFF_069460 [Zingiber officinale]